MKNTVFYADDDLDDLDFFQVVIDELGHDVFLFLMGDDLLEAMDNPPPQASIVFLDLNMPLRSGYEILKELKASDNLKDIPVVILSTASDERSLERCKELGASFYVCKPNSMKEMKNAIHYILNIDWKNPPEEFLYCHAKARQLK